MTASKSFSLCLGGGRVVLDNITEYHVPALDAGLKPDTQTIFIAY